MESLYLDQKTKKTAVAILVGMMVVTLAILMSLVFQFSLLGNVVMSWILTTLYGIFAIFLVNPIRINPVQIVEKPIYKEVIQIVEKPVYREIQVPIENRVIEIVDRPVEKEVIREVMVDRPVYRTITKTIKRRKLNIPKFNYLGSSQTRTYHKRSCRFSKLIKKKYKVHSNVKSFFKRKHFKACKVCLKMKVIRNRISKK